MMTPSEELVALKPCPFCGGPSSTISQLDFWWVECAPTNDSDCAGKGPIRDTEAEAIVAWNARQSAESMSDVERKGEQSYEIDCPKCGAEAHQLCSLDDGTPLPAMHGARRLPPRPDPRQDEEGVTQADRQAAVDAIADWQTIPFSFKDDLAQAFAAHRRAFTISTPREDFAPCPTCRQYSHSIGEDRLAEAFNHFQSMFSHRGDGIPTQYSFDEKTRDAAQVLMAAAARPTLREDEVEEEAYEIGKQDGRSEAIQEIDRATGGDGEYRYCMGHHDPERHCPDPETMAARIVERFATLTPREQRMEEAWQPIETAPKDAFVIGWAPGWMRPSQVIFCAFIGKRKKQWRFSNLSKTGLADPPTHWRPLPEPPALASADAVLGEGE